MSKLTIKFPGKVKITATGKFSFESDGNQFLINSGSPFEKVEPVEHVEIVGKSVETKDEKKVPEYTADDGTKYTKLEDIIKTGDDPNYNKQACCGKSYPTLGKAYCNSDASKLLVTEDTSCDGIVTTTIMNPNNCLNGVDVRYSDFNKVEKYRVKYPTVEKAYNCEAKTVLKPSEDEDLCLGHVRQSEKILLERRDDSKEKDVSADYITDDGYTKPLTSNSSGIYQTLDQQRETS